MRSFEESESLSALRRLPSIDSVLRSEVVQPLMVSDGRDYLVSLAQEVVGGLRSEIQETFSPLIGLDTGELLAEVNSRILRKRQSHDRSRTQRVINATGVVIHTNLGRAPLSENARRALVDAAGASSVEYDIDNGSRGLRGTYAEELITELTSADGAIVVNNCAAAMFLALTVFAAGKEVVISRGELVEIGGDFRIPDVLARSGAQLVEVGTTNRTKLSDYENAINENTGMILSVHPSNYRIVGFTSGVGVDGLVQLAHSRGLLFYQDAGSGALIDLNEYGLEGEPVIPRSIELGTDIVSFSGDKLLGGPQCGIIIGRGELIEKIRKHPLYRALRVDKLTYAALEATLESYRRGSALQDIPVLKMISATEKELEVRCRAFLSKCQEIPGMKIEILAGASVIGGGAAPNVKRVSPVIAVSHSTMSADDIETKFRYSNPPIIVRIEKDLVLIDLRTVSEKDENEIIRAFSHFDAKTQS